MLTIDQLELRFAVQPGNSFRVRLIIKLWNKRRRILVGAVTLPLLEMAVFEIRSRHQAVEYFRNHCIIGLSGIPCSITVGKNGCQQDNKNNRKRIEVRSFHR